MEANSRLPRFVPLLRRIGLCLALAGSGAFAQQNPDVAALEATAQRGDAQALIALAVKYERGENVAQDFAKSNDLYCKAAARGNADALLNLALIYAAGREVPADEGVVAVLIAKAAEHGSERARELLEHVSRRTGSVLPACLTEPLPVHAEAVPVPAARKDIELLIQQWAPKYSVDPDLVRALIAAESNFAPNAVSPKNAQGLMQLIPATAERFGVKNAYNPLENLKGGLAYLRWLLAYFKGDVALALAGYNAGEEAVERYRGIPPYKETRNYVKQITSVYKKTSHPYVAQVAAASSAIGRISAAQ
jgi:soluble lytic murein transglycosylase-like protein